MICKRHIVQTLILLGLACGVAFAEAPARQNYTRAQIEKMVHDARTAEQYRQLAEYYRSREQEYRERAHLEEREWARRTLDDSSPCKYPTPEDSSKYRYEYFTYEAAKMSVLAERYYLLAASLLP
jgi:hypothetical protein